MKQYVSVWAMHKNRCHHTAFTLIEVMVAVMIVSVVIAALLQMQGNANNSLLEIKKMLHSTQYSSFLLSNSEKYGFENSRVDMERLLEDFELESDLRRRLKAMKVEVAYEELEFIDTSKLTQEIDESEFDDGLGGEQASGVLFELGKTELISSDFKTTNIRVRMQ